MQENNLSHSSPFFGSPILSYFQVKPLDPPHRRGLSKEKEKTSFLCHQIHFPINFFFFILVRKQNQHYENKSNQ